MVINPVKGILYAHYVRTPMKLDGWPKTINHVYDSIYPMLFPLLLIN